MVVLGSATPSLEIEPQRARGQVRRCSCCPAASAARRMARVEVVDRREALEGAAADPILTPPLREALAERLATARSSRSPPQPPRLRDEPPLPRVRLQAMCPNCSVALTLHKGGRVALCHYCAYETADAARLRVVQGRVPAAHRLRHGEGGGGGAGGAARRARRAPRPRPGRPPRARSRACCRLRGGRDGHPGGHADDRQGPRLPARDAGRRRSTPTSGSACPTSAPPSGRSSSSRRSAGRAGRADLPGEVDPAEPPARPLRARSSPARRTTTRSSSARWSSGARWRYPPAAALVNLILRARDSAEGAEAARAVAAARLRGQAAGNFRVLGPAFAPLARLRQEHRFQVLLKGPAQGDAGGGARGPGRALRQRALARRDRGRRPRHDHVRTGG